MLSTYMLSTVKLNENVVWECCKKMFYKKVLWVCYMRILTYSNFEMIYKCLSTKQFKYLWFFQHWWMIDTPGPRDADASKNGLYVITFT